MSFSVKAITPFETCGCGNTEDLTWIHGYEEPEYAQSPYALWEYWICASCLHLGEAEAREEASYSRGHRPKTKAAIRAF